MSSCSRLAATARGSSSATSAARELAPGSTVTIARSSPNGITSVCGVREPRRPETVTPSCSSSPRTNSPARSSPSGATSVVRSPSRVAATAVIAPPPGERSRSPAKRSSPSAGSASSPTTVRSRNDGVAMTRSTLTTVQRIASGGRRTARMRRPPRSRASGTADSIARLTSRAATSLPVRRNTLILAATMAVYSAVLQLVAAVSSLTFVLVTGVEGLLGLGPAIFLASSGLAAVPAGRLMDRVGRRPVIAGGYAAASAGCALTALATNLGSAPLVILGFGLTGAASGIALLIRTAAGDLYPPEHRARGISYVLFGSVFGAILGPAVFGPLFSGRELDAAALTVPWLTAGGISVIALALVLFVRPDPKRIAEAIAAG